MLGDSILAGGSICTLSRLLSLLSLLLLPRYLGTYLAHLLLLSIALAIAVYRYCCYCRLRLPLLSIAIAVTVYGSVLLLLLLPIALAATVYCTCSCCLSLLPSLAIALAVFVAVTIDNALTTANAWPNTACNALGNSLTATHISGIKPTTALGATSHSIHRQPSGTPSTKLAIMHRAIIAKKSRIPSGPPSSSTSTRTSSAARWLDIRWVTASWPRRGHYREGDKGSGIVGHCGLHHFCIRSAIRLYLVESKVMIITIPTGPHERLHLFNNSEIEYQITQMGLRANWKAMGATTFGAQGGDVGEGDSTGRPMSERPGALDWPTLVIEAGYSESLEELRRAARWWFRASDHKVIPTLQLCAADVWETLL